jgi:hypothetical protein
MSTDALRIIMSLALTAVGFALAIGLLLHLL